MSFRDQVLSFNKHVTNRLTIKIAGRPHSPISIVHHIGRRSGKPYETPIIVQPIPGGFMFALTYGPDVDWYRNVLAAGRCSLVWHGKTYQLERPQPVDSETGLSAFPFPFSPMLKLMGIRHFFRMEISGRE